MPLTQVEERTSSKVSYRLTGDFDSVITCARELLELYPWSGYMTRIKDLGPAPAEIAEGRWQCVVERLASCD